MWVLSVLVCVENESLVSSLTFYQVDWLCVPYFVRWTSLLCTAIQNSAWGQANKSWQLESFLLFDVAYVCFQLASHINTWNFLMMKNETTTATKEKMKISGYVPFLSSIFFSTEWKMRRKERKTEREKIRTNK